MDINISQREKQFGGGLFITRLILKIFSPKYITNSKMVDNWTIQTFKSKEEYFLKNLDVFLNNYLSKYEHYPLGDFDLATST